VQKEFTNKFISEIDMMLNHYRFDEALKIVPQIESESTSNIKACYLSARVYLVKEDWDNLERIRNMYNAIPPSIKLEFQYIDRKLISYFNQLAEHKMDS
jgi:hypothetical protein